MNSKTVNSSSTILVVDDTIANLKLLDQQLKHAGYQVQLAINGQLALATINRQAPDLVLLDINMPNMDGYEVCRQIKANTNTAELPVIFISALDDIADKLKGFEIGGLDFITKPFHAQEVLARVSTHLKLQEMQKQLQSKNLLLQQEITQRQQTQQQLVEAEKMASLGRLVSGVAHEINTPLGIAITSASSLSNLIEACQKNIDSGQVKRSQLNEFMTQISEIEAITTRNLQRSASIVTSFKQVAVNLSSEHKTQFKLSQHLQELLSGFQVLLNKAKVKIHLDCPSDIEVYAQPDSLLQIISQLLNNSLDHGFEQGKTKSQQNEIRINISYTTIDQQVTICYQDNGIGMDDKQLASIYEPFFTSNRGKGSLGLGMHIVYNLVSQALAGSIHAESELGQGLKYIIKFNSATKR